MVRIRTIMKKKIFQRLKYLMNFLKRNLIFNAKQIGSSDSQCVVVCFLADQEKNGKEVYAKNIEEHFNLKKSCVCEMLNSMEQNKLISRGSGKNGDSRYKEILLTDKGRELSIKAQEIMDKGNEIVLSALSESEQDKLFELLDKIIIKMEDYENEKSNEKY